MRRQLGTVVSVVSLLAIGVGAAAVNVRVLQGSGSSSLVLTNAGDMTLMDAAVTPSASASAAAITTAPATVQATTSALASATAKASVAAVPSTKASSTPSASPTASDKTGLKPIDGGFTNPDGTKRERHDVLEPRPQLTQAQLDVLRVAMLAHVPPEVVIAVAKGDTSVPADVVQLVQTRAAYANIDLSALSNVPDVPKLRDRGHGGPNEYGGTNVDS